METFLFLLLGFALGFLLILLIKLGQGKMAHCPRCGQQHWVNPKKVSPVCKKCGSLLRLEKNKPHKTGKPGGKRKKK